MKNTRVYMLSVCDLHLVNDEDNIVELSLPNQMFHKDLSEETIIRYFSQYNRANERIANIYFDLQIFEDGKQIESASYCYSVDYNISAYDTKDFSNPKLILDEKRLY